MSAAYPKALETFARETNFVARLPTKLDLISCRSAAQRYTNACENFKRGCHTILAADAGCVELQEFEGLKPRCMEMDGITLQAGDNVRVCDLGMQLKNHIAALYQKLASEVVSKLSPVLTDPSAAPPLATVQKYQERAKKVQSILNNFEIRADIEVPACRMACSGRLGWAYGKFSVGGSVWANRLGVHLGEGGKALEV